MKRCGLVIRDSQGLRQNFAANISSKTIPSPRIPNINLVALVSDLITFVLGARNCLLGEKTLIPEESMNDLEKKSTQVEITATEQRITNN